MRGSCRSTVPQPAAAQSRPSGALPSACQAHHAFYFPKSKAGAANPAQSPHPAFIPTADRLGPTAQRTASAAHTCAEPTRDAAS